MDRLVEAESAVRGGALAQRGRGQQSDRADCGAGEIGQDIASINAFRLQVNERLIGLQSQLTALEKMLVESQLSAGAQ